MSNVLWTDHLTPCFSSDIEPSDYERLEKVIL